MGRKKSPYLKMLQESLIDFSKMTTHKGPASGVISYDGQGELDFYKPVNDVVSILERYYLKEGSLDADDTPIATGAGVGRDKNPENSEWVEQDLVDMATQKASGQSGSASGGPGTIPNGMQPEGYDANVMDQDDSSENKEQTPDYGKKPVQESIELFDDLEALLEMDLPDVESNDDTNEVQGADAAAGKDVPELGDSDEFVEDFEVRPDADNTSKATMQEMLDEALDDLDEMGLEDNEDPFLEASELLEMEDEDTMEPSDDFGGGEGVPVMPAGDDDSIGDEGDQETDLQVPPVGDQEDEIDEDESSAEEEPEYGENEMYENDAFGLDEELEEGFLEGSDDLSEVSLDEMLQEMDDDISSGEVDDAGVEDDDEEEADDLDESLDDMLENLGDSGMGPDDGEPNVGPGPSGVESVDNEIGPDRGQGTPGEGRRADATAEALEEFDEFLWEDAEDGGQDFFQSAVDESGEEPVASEDSADTKDLFGGKDEGIPDSDKASSWAEVDESALFEDVDTERTAPGKSGNDVVPTGPAQTSSDSMEFEPMEEDADTELTEPGKAGNAMSDIGEQHRTDLGPDAGGAGDKLEGLEESDDLFEEALKEEDEMDLSSEPTGGQPAEIQNADRGTLPNEEPNADEDQPAKIENASLTNEQVIRARKTNEENVVERLIREFENYSDEDIILESVDLEDESFDEFSE